MLRGVLLAGAVGSLLATPAYAEGRTEPADLARFLQSATNAAHITAAMATVNSWGCNNPFEFLQEKGVSQEEGGRGEDTITLYISCSNDDVDGYAMLMFFRETEIGLEFWEMWSIP